MASMADEDESQNGSSDNENDIDETMEDGEEEQPQDGDEDNDDNEEDDDQDDDGDDMDESPSKPPRRRSSIQQASFNRGSRLKDVKTARRDSGNGESEPDEKTDSRHPKSPHTPARPDQGISYRPDIRSEAIEATIYDIVPTIAAPHSTSINTVAATPDMKWVFSGGTDGWIRKFNWVDTANGKAALTVAQRHPFVDSVTKAGVLNSYWENEDELDGMSSTKAPDEGGGSPVYSLAVHRHALWLLSGTESGAINLQSVRHQEGHKITTLRQHSSAVSVMVLAQDEKSFLSGSWDKTILDWDLNTGKTIRSFTGSGGQISAIEMRPLSSVPVPRDIAEKATTNPTGTFSSNTAPKENTPAPMISEGRKESKVGLNDSAASPTDSLFGGGADDASLFGDDSALGGGMGYGDEDGDDFSRAIAKETGPQQTLDADGDVDMNALNGVTSQGQSSSILESQPTSTDMPNGNSTTTAAPSEPPSNASPLKDIDTVNGNSNTITNTIPTMPNDPFDSPLFDTQSTTQPPPFNPTDTTTSSTPPVPTSESTFLDAAIDGTLRIWDRRQPTPVARLLPPSGTPPWCMHAAWSHDGNFIYAGRRNGTVEEYSLHHHTSASSASYTTSSAATTSASSSLLLRNPARTLRFPAGSGAVSAVRALPNGRHLVCASYDILRLYDLHADGAAPEERRGHNKVPFLIVPGHRTGVVSQLFMDASCRFMISTGGNRGWEGSSTEVLLGYEIGCQK